MTWNRPFVALLGTAVVLGGLLLAAMPKPSEAVAAPDAPIAPAGAPILLELFTSQGCSSCPPADRLAETLAREPGLVVIARPVTYWDRLGWKDTLAREENTALQQDYARAGLGGQNGVYTPQIVVDGTWGTVGSRAAEIAQGVRRHGGKGEAALRVAPGAGGGYAVNIAGKSAGTAELVLLAVTRKVEVGIGRGENQGRKVAYTNVLRAERKLADWQGGQREIAVTADALKVPGADRYALVLRMPDGGRVLASRWLG